MIHTPRFVVALALVGALVSSAEAQRRGPPGARRGQAREAAGPMLNAEWIDQIDWRSIGPANMGGRMVDIEVYEADPCIFWVATASGGLLKTTNDGITFEHQFDSETTVSIGDVAICQSDPNLVWVGTGENNPRNSVSFGDGVYKSVDGGETWKNMGLAETFQIGRIQIHPENPDVVYVGALGRLYGPNEERGLFKTTDGGETWEKVLYVDDQTGVIDVDMDPSNPDHLLVATYERERDGFDGNDPAKKNGPGSGLYRTTDGGKTFSEVTEGLPTVNLGRIGIDWYRKDPSIVYMVLESELTSQEGENTGEPGFSGENAETGARVTSIEEEGAAAEAGLEQGDIILSVDDKTVLSYNQMITEIRRREAEETLKLEVARAGEALELELTLKKRPEPEEREDEEQPRARRGRSPFSSGLGGQRENIQDQQGKKGHEHGGVYRSEDGGKSWTRINSVNPRPMYYSQIRVDPSDDNYMFVLGTSLYRTSDRGVTFTGDGHGRGVHVDHHAMWIDPRDGRHVLLGNDGGLFVTRDRAANWDHLNFMALGQFYHVEVGPRRNYMVYGGLQDNGSWGARHRSRGTSGPINEDWLSVGGGDGFVVRVDREDPDVIYTESQGGSMSARNLMTGERWGIRPPRPEGGERVRFNWKTPFILSHHNSRIFYCAGNFVFRSLDRGRDLKTISPDITRSDQGSGSALAESPRNPDVLYVGTTDGALWVTRNGGHEWTDLLGMAEGGLAKAEGEAEDVGSAPSSESEESAGENGSNGSNGTAQEESADDPISGKWTAVVEMEGMEGEAFDLILKRDAEGKITGSMTSRMGDSTITSGKYDAETGAVSLVTSSEMGEATIEGKLIDGKLEAQLSGMGGAFVMPFTATRQSEGQEAEEPEVGDPLHQLIPGPMWVTSLEASRYKDGRVYLALDGHRSDNDEPWLFVSENYGKTWTSLRGELPRGSTRCLREDISNENVLWLGTEFGAWVSIDRGGHWTRLHGDTLPTVAVHEIAQHPTSGEIVAGTHGRSLWIADVTPLRQMSAETLAARAHLYRPNDVVLWTSAPRRGVSSLSTFVGANPPNSAAVYYTLGSEARQVSLKIEDAAGTVVSELEADGAAGLHRVEWNLRLAPPSSGATTSRQASGRGGGGFGGRFRGGRTAAAGTYQVVLEVEGEAFRQPIAIERDPEYPDYRYLAVEEELEQEQRDG